ncbi:MAG: CBS domain-containing protein [Desulfobacterales bacterium]|nr:CBS domain-containing protein [Desulfobacterales bacterium]
MFVSKSMATRVITISKETSVFEAKDKMLEHKIRHLPVLEDDGRLTGIVTDRDIRSALPRKFFSGADTPGERQAHGDMPVGEVMTPRPMTISSMDTIQDALLLILEKRVGAFPVVDEEGTLVGMISVRDLLRAFINVLGIGEPGALLCIIVEEGVGQMKKIVDAVTEMNISFGSILVARYWEEDKRAVFPYLLTQNVGPVKRKMKEMGLTILDPRDWYMDKLPDEERSDR